MEHFQIQFFSTSQFGGILDIEYSVEQSQIIFDLLDIFNAQFDTEQQQINSDYKHQNTKEFQIKLKNYVLKYKDIDPKVQQFGAKFKKLKENEWFFLLPPIKLNTQMQYALERELNELNGNSNIDGEKILKTFDCILNNYELTTFDLEKDRKIKIGENDREKRVCRFCKEKQPNVKFGKEAHAISEALGNKKLILNEECDDCNKFFDENIERDFIYYHDLIRTICGVKGKNNNLAKMENKNFKLYTEKDSKKLAIKFKNAEEETKPPKNIIFETGQKIKRQNIYKALCKFALSVLNTKYLKDFDNTIQWLKDEKEVNKLPKVAVLTSNHFFTKTAKIILYLRNNDNKKLPYLIGEFRFTFYVYIFIVPFSNQDNSNFLIANEYQEFLHCFKHITVKSDKGQIQYIDFSQNIERELNFNINFIHNID